MFIGIIEEYIDNIQGNKASDTRGIFNLVNQPQKPRKGGTMRIKVSAYISLLNSSPPNTPLNPNNPQKPQPILNIHLNPPQIIPHRTQPVAIIKNHKNPHRQMVQRNLPPPVLILHNLHRLKESIRKLHMIPQRADNSTFQHIVQPNLPVMFNNPFYEHTAFTIQHRPSRKSNTENRIQSFTFLIQRKSINFTVKISHRGNLPTEKPG